MLMSKGGKSALNRGLPTCWTALIGILLMLGLLFVCILSAGEALAEAEDYVLRFLWSAVLLVFLQMARIPLFRWLLAGKAEGGLLTFATGFSWFAALIPSAYIASAVTNLSIRVSYFGALLAPASHAGLNYGQLLGPGEYDFGLPDYFIALCVAIIIDLAIILALLRWRSFRLALTASFITNAIVYGALAFVMVGLPALYRLL